MLHVVCSTNTNVTYTLGYCFMKRATEEDLQWIWKYVENAIIIKPSVIVVDADKALVNACAEVCPSAHHLLCYWHVKSNIKAYHIWDYPTDGAAGLTQWTFVTFLQKWRSLVRGT